MNTFEKHFIQQGMIYSKHRLWKAIIVVTAARLNMSFLKKKDMDRVYAINSIVSDIPKKILLELSDELLDEVSKHRFFDNLGYIYGSLELADKYNGQFFTPYEVSQLMAQIQLHGDTQEKEQENLAVNDCCCGSGSLLIAFAEQLNSMSLLDKYWFFAQDIDMTAALMCYIQLALLNVKGYVKIGNTLTEPLDVNNLVDMNNMWALPANYGYELKKGL